MSAPCPLAVMRTAADALAYAGAKREGVQQVIDAHAAVAELVWAARPALAEVELIAADLRECNSVDGKIDPEAEDEVLRLEGVAASLNAALAKFGGAP